MIATISTTVDVEIDMEEIDTADLLNELIDRDCASVELVLKWLDKLKVPVDLVMPIKDYFGPPAGQQEGDRWVEFANV